MTARDARGRYRPYPTPPPEIDTAEAQADWYADVQRAMDEDEARRPSVAELARDEAEWE